MKKFIVLTIIFLTVSIFFLSSADAQFLFFGNPLVGKPAPEFTLNSLSGEKINLTQYRERKPAILFFWATWCPHCRVALNKLNRMRESLKKEQIKVLAIDIGEGFGEVRSYARRNNIQLEILLDRDTTLAGPYGIMGVPTFVFLDKNGIVLSVKHKLPYDYADILHGKK